MTEGPSEPLLWMPYDNRYPRAPVVELILSSEDKSQSIAEITALIDTGADMSFIPETFALNLGLTEVGRMPIRTLSDETPELRTLYAVRIKIGEMFDELVRVAAWGDEILIGRDILRKLTLLLCGPGSYLTIAP